MPASTNVLALPTRRLFLAEWKAWVGNSLIRPYLKQNPVSLAYLAAL